MILVVGATGTNGREVLDRLVAAGQAASGRWSATRPRPGDLRGPASSSSAATSTTPPRWTRPWRASTGPSSSPRSTRGTSRWFDNFLDAARREGPHVVKFSGIGADPDSPVEIMRQHGETDAQARRLGPPYTILRPNSFYQNLLWSAGSIRDQGAFYQPMGDARQSLVDVRDIADVAVAALTQAGHEGKTYEITGPESLTYAEVAGTLSAVLGKPVKYVDVPPEAALDAMLKAGMPEWNARAVTELVRLFAAGYAPGRPTRSSGSPGGRRPPSLSSRAIMPRRSWEREPADRRLMTGAGADEEEQNHHLSKSRWSPHLARSGLNCSDDSFAVPQGKRPPASGLGLTQGWRRPAIDSRPSGAE